MAESMTAPAPDRLVQHMYPRGSCGDESPPASDQLAQREFQRHIDHLNCRRYIALSAWLKGDADHDV